MRSFLIVTVLAAIASSSLAFVQPAALFAVRGGSKLNMGLEYPANAAKPLAAGDSLPAVTVKHVTGSGDVKEESITDLFKGKKAVLFGVPGAFTPTCSEKHLPGFIEKATELKSKGVDVIACTSCNDAFVMKAWGLAQEAGENVTMVADGSGELAAAMGLQLDLLDKGMGVRNKRYAAILDDNKVTYLEEDDGSFAEAVLSKL